MTWPFDALWTLGADAILTFTGIRQDTAKHQSNSEGEARSRPEIADQEATTITRPNQDMDAVK